MKQHVVRKWMWAALAFCALACSQTNETKIMSNITDATVAQLTQEMPAAANGIAQAAALWRADNGSELEFMDFCRENYMASEAQRSALFDKLSTAFEQLFGTANRLSVELKKPIHLVGPELMEIDYILGNYEPGAHTMEDLFANKVAFITILNFPHYTLAQKNDLGMQWSRQEWAYARMGDVFTSRVPASVRQELANAEGNAENYIASYNIMMGHLLTPEGERLFPEDMVLLSHWNLRDEIKSNYADVPNAFAKQQMIYKVMEHIACQTIPQQVINNPAYDWAPYANTVFQNGKEVTAQPEGEVRYQMWLNNFKSYVVADAYYPQMPTAILRNFEGGMEVSAQEIEELFVRLISSPQVAKVAALIKERLGRDLEPYDIWYDGFKSRSTLSEDYLTAITRAKYPTPAAFEKDMPNLLQNLGFSKEKAKYLSSKIVVEGARGSGHAWGAGAKGDVARLRTRIGANGMDYKGYNIAVHEFGHNVEQTLSLYDVDYFMLNGVPNTAYTEALAFVFQKRDLKLLGYPFSTDSNTALDIFWGAYEIMGVALVDMYVWQWLYAHPEATAAQLKEAVLDTARRVWNQYYAPVLGTEDSPILAIYSHTINSPMYLPNYPFGHIIEYQLEDYFANEMVAKGRDFAKEIERMFTLGTLTPQIWMQQAVGSHVSIDPLLKAVDKAVENN